MNKKFSLISFTLLISLFTILLSCRESKKVNEDLPSINIITKNQLNFENYRSAKLVYNDDSKIDTLKAYIKFRGGTSVRYEKKSMSIKIGSDFKFNQESGTSKWILNASYIDKTLMRHKIAFDLFKEMDDGNKSPDCSYVKIFRNNNYQGIYVLMKRLNEKTLELENSGFIYKEPKIYHDSLYTLDIKKQKYPDRDDSSAYKSLQDFQRFIHFSDQQDFDREIFKRIDIQSFADWYLLLLFSNNSDGVLKNFYVYKTNKKSKLKVAPWDYDHSWGRDGDNELNMNSDIAENRSVLFKKLLRNEEFLSTVKQRWNKHRKNNVLSFENIKEHINRNKSIIVHELEKHFKFWPVNANWYYDDNNFQQEIDIILDFAEMNISELDKRFGYKKMEN